MNYYRANFFQRAEIKPAAYDEERFHEFLAAYTDSLNTSFRTCWQDGYFHPGMILSPLNDVDVRISDGSMNSSDSEFSWGAVKPISLSSEDDRSFSNVEEGEEVEEVASDSIQRTTFPSVEKENEFFLSTFMIREQIKEIYRKIPKEYGLSQPKSYQHPKCSSFNSLYSNVGVTGFMGPFFAESHVNHELSLLEYPFTYAHELSHLLGISSEAEANLWAYTVCTQSENPFIRFSGYFGLFSYVWSNTRFLLSSFEFDKWESSVPSEVMAAFHHKQLYWSMRYNETLGDLQSALYTFYLKRNRIASGQRNYSQVIGLLLSLPNFRVEWK